MSDKIWQKQPWESEADFGWFARFAELSGPFATPPRPEVRYAAPYRNARVYALSEQPGAPNYYELEATHDRNGWSARAEAWRAEKLRRTNEAAARRLNAPSETPARVAAVTRLQGVLAERELEKHLSVSEGTPAPVTSVREASRMAVAAVTLGRLELGAPVALDEQHAPDMSNWTDDEVVEWQAKLAEKAKGK